MNQPAAQNTDGHFGALQPWLLATILANMIWIMPQFSLCFDAIDNNLTGKTMGDSSFLKWGISGALFAFAAVMVYLRAMTISHELACHRRLRRYG